MDKHKSSLLHALMENHSKFDIIQGDDDFTEANKIITTFLEREVSTNIGTKMYSFNLPVSILLLVLASVSVHCNVLQHTVKPRISSSRSLDNALELSIIDNSGQTLLSGLLGLSSPSAVGGATGCNPDNGYDDCYQYGDYARLQVIYEQDNCTKFVWSSTFARRLEDCFNLSPGAHWYGGGETFVQTWPVESVSRPEVPHVTADFYNTPYGGVVESYWIISTGVAVQVDDDVPLFISWNTTHANQVCFVAKDEYPYKQRDSLQLKYSVCTGSNLKEVQQRTIRKYYSTPPIGTPDRTMILRPFWSTWAQYHENVNQSVVLDYARRLRAEGFNLNSHIEIDDDWETCYGDAVFSPQKFPNVTEMVQQLRELDFKVTLWIHPFINYGCPSFETAFSNGYFVTDEKARPQPQITSWWQGARAGAIDFTNPNATAWWKARLEALQQQYGIDSYKFDAGETYWLPYSNSLAEGDPNLQPNQYTTRYVEALGSFGGMIEVRAGHRNQREPFFTRMFDKDSRWGYNNGLKSLIPTLLYFAVIGYPFVLPDMIGGNAYDNVLPTPELYIRWMQANAFMPAVQFSLVPWDFGAQAIQVTQEILALREEYQDLIFKAVDEALDGEPINRPMWWEDPEDPITYTIDSQYMLGEDILVAPVVDEGQTSRDIYLTRGVWVGNNNVTYTGPQLLRNYSAPLDTLPYFIKSSTLTRRNGNKGQLI